MRSKRLVIRGIAPGNDEGAAAVELALVLPVFLLIVLGIFEFGRALNIQVSLTQAARESVRYAAVHYGDTGFTIEAAKAAGVAAAPSVPLANSNFVISYSPGSTCATGVSVVSTVTYSTGFITGLETMIGAAQPFTIKGVGVMRCGG